MDAQRARASWRAPRLDCRQLTALADAAGGELPRALEARTLRGVALDGARARVPAHARTRPRSAPISTGSTRVVRPSCCAPIRSTRRCCARPPTRRRCCTCWATARRFPSPQLAMVGSRHASDSGARTAREFAAWFARAGLTVTSGLGRGIDAASHEGALRGGGLTVAVCGSGLDRIYPPEHAALAQRIAHGGALVSESRAAHAAAAGAFPAAQPHHRGPHRRHAGGGGGAHQLGARDRAARRRPGTRGVCHSRLDPQSARARSASTHPAGAKLVEDADDVLIELKNSIAERRTYVAAGEF